RPVTRASWNGPSVTTSRSPTRVLTRSPGAVVNVTTTSSGPTLMSSACATVTTNGRSGATAAGDASRESPRSPLQTGAVGAQPRCVHPLVQGVVAVVVLDRRRLRRRDRGEDRRDLLRGGLG